PRPHAAEPALGVPGAERHATRVERGRSAAPARAGKHPRPPRTRAIVRATGRPRGSRARSRESPRAGTKRLRRRSIARARPAAPGRFSVFKLSLLLVQLQPRDGFAADQVLVDDFVDVGDGDVA